MLSYAPMTLTLAICMTLILDLDLDVVKMYLCINCRSKHSPTVLNTLDASKYSKGQMICYQTEHKF